MNDEEVLVETVEMVKQGRVDDAVIDRLFGLFCSDASNVMFRALDTLNEIVGPAQAFLAKAFEGGNTERARSFAQVIKRWRWWNHELDAALVVRATLFMDRRDRVDLVNDCLRTAELPPEVFEETVLALQAGNDEAAAVLGDFGGSLPAKVVAHFVELLTGEYSYSRDLTIQVLGKVGPKAREAVPILGRLLREDPTSCWGVPEALAGILGKDCVPLLIEVLVDPFFHRDGDECTRASALDGLGEIGADARAAVPAVVGALRDPNEYVRNRAAAALGAIDPETAAGMGVG